MIESYNRFWEKIFVVNESSGRQDYWVPTIVNYLLAVIIVAIIQAITGHPINEIYNYGDFFTVSAKNIIMAIAWIANLTLAIRRLHDTDRSGWWILIQIIPIIGTIWFIILMLLPTKPNRWA